LELYFKTTFDVAFVSSLSSLVSNFFKSWVKQANPKLWTSYS